MKKFLCLFIASFLLLFVRQDVPAVSDTDTYSTEHSFAVYTDSYAAEDFADFRQEDLSLYAASAVLIDADSGRILYGKSAAEPMANASTTKILTCILALENGSPDDVVTVSDYACTMPKVKLGFSAGDTFYLRDLLYS